MNQKLYSSSKCMSLFLMVVFCFLEGCGGARSFTRGKYDDPTRIELLDDKFNEADMQQMAEAVVNELHTCPALLKAEKTPIVILEKIKNDTQEHIDTQSLTDKIQTALLHSGSLRFVNAEARDTLEKEYAYQSSGKVTKATAKQSGGQLGADYMMTGVLATNIQEVGRQKYVYYKLTVNLTHITQSTIDCSIEKEIRKSYSKRRIVF